MLRRTKADMIEATRLTREGRLDEALALLQGRRADPGTSDSERVSDRSADPLIDMQPPMAGSGGAWTAPFARHAEDGPAADRPRAPRPPDLRRGPKPRAGFNGPSGLMQGLAEGLASQWPGGGGCPTSGPGPELPPGARFDEAIHTGPAGSRPYKLFVPAGHEGRALPLVVMLHGCTQSPDDFAAGTRMNELAQETGFLVVYPGQTQAANMSKCWNWFNAADQQRDRGEPSLIAGITREVMAAHPVEPGRVYVAGLSAGGAKAAIMGATYPDLFAAVGVHSGLACGAAHDMPSAFAAMRQGATGRSVEQMPTIVFHGDRDTTVHPANADAVALQARAGTALRATVARGRSEGGVEFTRTVHVDPEGRAVLEEWALHGAGHAWSGGSRAGSYTDPLGPDASRAMLRFFLEHDRPAVAESGRRRT